MWSQGRWQEAINAYFKLDSFTSRQMAEGRDLHAEWEEEIKKTKCLPKVFGGKQLNSQIITEKKFEIPVYDWMTLVLKPDVVSSPDLHEFKSGSASANEYLDSFQPAVYCVGLTLMDIYIKTIHIHAYNQYTKRSDYSYRFASKKLLNEGFNFIQTIGGEMYIIS